MAKLYKVEMYILDVNEKYDDLGSIMMDMENSTDVNFDYFNEQETDIEWDDNVKINNTNCTIEDYRKYFKQD